MICTLSSTHWQQASNLSTLPSLQACCNSNTAWRSRGSAPECQQYSRNKILFLAYSCLNSTAPQCLQELIPWYLLHAVSSVDQGKKKKHFGVEAFWNAAPTLWNSLPLLIIRECCSTSMASLMIIYQPQMHSPSYFGWKNGKIIKKHVKKK